MRTLISAVLILAITAVALFLVVHFAFDGEIPGWSSQNSSDSVSTSDMNGGFGIPSPSDVKDPEGTEDVADDEDDAGESTAATDVDAIPVPRGRTIYYSGILFEGGRPFGGQELTLQTNVDGETVASTRTVYTVPKSGEFVLTLRESEYPARLVDANNELLVRIDQVPFHEKARLNVHVERPAWGRVMTATVITAIQTIDNCRILVYGQTELDPKEENLLITRLSCGGKTVTEGLLEVDGGPMIGDIDTGGPLPFAGHYRLELAWRPGEATAAQTLQLQEKGLLRSSQGAEIIAKSRVFLGRASEEEEQERVIVKFYEDAVRDCRMIRALISEVGNEFRDAGIRISKNDRQRLRSYPLYANVGRLLSGSAFSKKRWRRFVDEECQQVFARYTDDKVPYPEKHPARARKVVQLFSKLNRFLRLESQLLYGAIKEPPERKDYVSREFPTETQWGMDKLALDRFLEEFQQLNRSAGRRN